MNGLRLPIFGHFGPKSPILDSSDFIKKALGTFLSRLQALTGCKISEKSNERFSRNCVTDGRDSLGLKRLRRETKKN